VPKEEIDLHPARQIPLGSPSKPSKRENNEVESVREIASPTQIPQSSLRQLSPVALAYIGDAVYELHIRTHYLLPCLKIADHHHKVVQQVRAETQAHHLQQITPLLSAEELNWIKRGKNSVKKSPRRLSLTIYQQATGLETLLGYLYISNPSRLNYILSQLDLEQKISKKEKK